ncbi:hypothetical protein SO802_028288 [Lithocarpus litseifolius]|uniref:DCD domain-containing protein n=1 Tax=Lithocarpus litseifolius TaxID=425828 RepID=A0AAW2BSY1_9ROSI
MAELWFKFWQKIKKMENKSPTESPLCPPKTVYFMKIFIKVPKVRIQIKKKCKPLEEDEFRPILHHNDGPKFRLKLSVPEVSLYVLPIYLVSKLLHS